MALNRLSREEILIGKEKTERLKHCRVAVFGVGGVGGYVVEGLARSGIGALDLIDNDTVSLTNLNRQIIATEDNIGCVKVDEAEKRVRAISSEIAVRTYPCFYLPEEKDRFDFSAYDYIVDAVDTVTAKIDLVMEAQKNHVPIISAMGCGNRLDPFQLKEGDIFETKGDPLCRIMRHELRKRHIDHLKVVYSEEPPIRPLPSEKESTKRQVPGSMVFVPGTAGLMIASIVVRDLIQDD